MAGHIRLEVEKLPKQALNLGINSEVYKQFQRVCKQQDVPMNVVIETFVRQYGCGRYELNKDDVLKYKDNVSETTNFGTFITKDVYSNFKSKVKSDGYFVKHVLTAFMKEYGEDKLVIEFTKKGKE